MKAIIESINERSQISAALFNAKQDLKSAINWEKIYKANAASMTKQKVYAVIQKDIDSAVNELSSIEPLCKKYWDLYGNEFTQVKDALHKFTKKQPLA